MEDLRDAKIREELDRQFGTHPSTREIKHAIFLARKGAITEEVIEQYKRQKEEEVERFREVMPEANPEWAFKTGQELLAWEKSQESLNEQFSESTSATGKCECSEHRRNEDAVSVDQIEPMYSTEREYEEQGDVRHQKLSGLSGRRECPNSNPFNAVCYSL